jgi:hypothetical protein
MRGDYRAAPGVVAGLNVLLSRRPGGDVHAGHLPRRTLDADDPSLPPDLPTTVFHAIQRETPPPAEIERFPGVPPGTVKPHPLLAMHRPRSHLGEYGPQADRPNGEQP